MASAKRAISTKANVSQDDSDSPAMTQINNRMRRAHGQLGAVLRMLEEGRDCEEIVHQIAAVSKAINTAAFTLISSSLKECIESDQGNRDEITERLQKLFLSLA